MKKILNSALAFFAIALVVLTASVSLSAATVKPTTVLKLAPGATFEHSLDKYGNKLVTSVLLDSNSAEITIYNADMTVLKSFKIDDIEGKIGDWRIYLDGTEYRNVVCYEGYEGPVASQRLFNDDDMWEIILSGKDQKTDIWKKYVFNETGEFFELEGMDDFYYLYDKNNMVAYIFYPYADHAYEMVTFNDLSKAKVKNIPDVDMSAMPQFVKSGENHVIYIGDNTPRELSLTVCDINGQTVFASKTDGTDKVVIPGAVIRKGILVYSLTSGSKVVGKGRIFAK